jgi:hypothetical protein
VSFAQRIPQMPWYKAVNKALEGREWIADIGLLVVVGLSVLLLLRGDRLQRMAWFVYLVSP